MISAKSLQDDTQSELKKQEGNAALASTANSNSKNSINTDASKPFFRTAKSNVPENQLPSVVNLLL